MKLVARGLIATETRGLARLRPADYEDAAARGFARVRDEPVGGYAWRDRRDWAARLARRDPDGYGRRVLTDAGLSDCRYVARVSFRAYRRGLLPASPAEWGHLRESIRRIYEDLASSAAPSMGGRAG